MNSRDLLTAIAGTDNAYLRESERFGAIGAQIKMRQKRKRRAAAAVGISAALCSGVWGVLRQTPKSNEFVPPEDTNTRILLETVLSVMEETVRAPGTDAAPEIGREPSSDELSDSPDGEKTGQPSVPDEYGTLHPEPSETVLPTQGSENVSSAHNPGDPGGPHAVFTLTDADYPTAKEQFGRPITACERDGFLGYKLGMVSQNGDISAPGAYCLEVVYEFDDGTVALLDRDKHTGGPEGDAYEYLGRTFYVDTKNDYPGVYEDRTRVWYFPSDGAGIVYHADFGANAQPREIMDLIISLEI